MPKIGVLIVVFTLVCSLSFVFAGGKQEEEATEEVQKEEAEAEAVEETVLDLHQIQEKKGLTAWNGGLIGWTMADLEQTSVLFDPFLQYDMKLSKVKPNLAESWEISNDETVYTFKLREDVLFHDGEKMHADDVVASVHAIAANGKTTAYADSISQVRGIKDYVEGNADSIEGVEAIDEFTVRFTLDQPSFGFLWNIAYMTVLPKHVIWEDIKDNPTLFYQSDFFQKPIGTGPFMIEERRPGDVEELVVFKDYWKGKPKIDRVNIWNRDVLVLAQEGRLDFKWTKDPAQIQKLLDTEGMTGYPVEYPTYKRALWFNMTHPRMQDLRVRKAIGMAINKEEICEDFFNGFAAPWTAVMSPTYWSNRDLPPVPYDPEQAKQLVEEADFDTSKPLKFVYYYDTNEARDFVALIQDYLSKVGIKVETRLLEREVGAILHDKTQEWHIAFGARNAVFPGKLLQQYTTDNPINIPDYSNPEVDKLYEQMINTTDREKVKELADEIQSIIRNDLPSVQLYYTKSYIIHREGVNHPVKWTYRYSVPFPIKLHEWELTGAAAK